LVADFHRRGVKVLFPMMMWDQGTKAPGTDWPMAFAEFMKEIDADGVNGDTQDGVPLAFSLAAEKVNHPLAFEPEIGPSDEAFCLNILTWASTNTRRSWGRQRSLGSNRVARSNIQAAGSGKNQRSAIRLLQRRRLGNWDMSWVSARCYSDGEATRRVAPSSAPLLLFFETQRMAALPDAVDTVLLKPLALPTRRFLTS